jgi:hypothetical protein
VRPSRGVIQSSVSGVEGEGVGLFAFVDGDDGGGRMVVGGE